MGQRVVCAEAERYAAMVEVARGKRLIGKSLNPATLGAVL
jgi:hypothetical protein